MDDNNTNAEYEPIEELNQVDGKDGEALDPIEQDQVVAGGEASDDSNGTDGKEELRKGIVGDDDNAQDAILDA